MPLKLTSFICGTRFHGYSWTIANEDQLGQLVGTRELRDNGEARE